MNFVFEDKLELLNFTNCPDVNRSGVRRFAPSPLADHATSTAISRRFNSDTFFGPKNYIIATGVNHHPHDWAGGTFGDTSRASVFSFLNNKQLKDLQKGRAMLMLDQSLEGHQTHWLWEWFHKECEDYKVSPNAVIYVTGNQLALEQYNTWASNSNVNHKITVITYTHFERDVWAMAKNNNLTQSINDNIEYKQANLSSIKTYNCLQKRLRPHRLWFYTELYKAKLLDDGLVSMNPFTSNQTWLDCQTVPADLVAEANSVLPLILYGEPNNTQHDNYYIRRILTEVFYDSWLSVVSEVAYADSDYSVFLSEKTFKAIAGCHPFILLSGKGSLDKLRAMGYKTFDGWIDESYDTLPPFERFAAIINSIKKVIAIEDKMSWYKSLASVLEHNYNTLQYNSTHENPAVIKLTNCYKEYFK